jgi:hypothetical protein
MYSDVLGCLDPELLVDGVAGSLLIVAMQVGDGRDVIAKTSRGFTLGRFESAPASRWTAPNNHNVWCLCSTAVGDGLVNVNTVALEVVEESGAGWLDSRLRREELSAVGRPFALRVRR